MATNVGVIVGSLSRQSINRRLADALIGLAPADFSMRILRIEDLPLYNYDDDAQPAESVKRFKREVTGSDAIVFVTPEYNRSIPGPLKNALDHASRPYGQSVWAGRPAGIIGASIGAPGTSMAQQHLRNILAYLDMPTLNQPEVYLQVQDGTFGPDGRLADAGVEELLRSWMDRFAAWVKAHAPQHV